MGARSGAVLVDASRVKCLRTREDFDDSACHRPAQRIARRNDCRTLVDRSGIFANAASRRTNGATGCNANGATGRHANGAAGRDPGAGTCGRRTG